MAFDHSFLQNVQYSVDGIVASLHASSCHPRVVYGQYTTAKDCVQALRAASCIRTALSRGILSIYHTPSGLIA